MLKSFDVIKEQLGRQEQKKRIGVIAAQDEHTLDAVVLAAKDGLVGAGSYRKEKRDKQFYWSTWITNRTILKL